jgi:hypothetical protein
VILCYNLQIIFPQELNIKFIIYILRGVSYILSLIQKVMREMQWTFLTISMNIGWQSRELVSLPFLCHFVQDDMCLTLSFPYFRYSGLNLSLLISGFLLPVHEPALVHGKCLPAWKTFTNKSNFFLKKLFPHSMYVPQMLCLFKDLIICIYMILMIHGRI